MSCLLFWCCRGRQSDSDTEDNTNQQLRKDGDKIKRKKMWRERMWKRQQKKEQTVDRERAEELQAAQQPAAGEKGSDVPHLPAGLGSGILENISAETPEKMRTPLHDDFQSTEVVPVTSRDLTDYLQDQIEAEAKAEAIKLLDEEEAHNNQPLGDKMLEMMVMNGEAQVIKDLVLTDLQDLQNDNLKDMNSADTEAEAIKQQMQIHGDEPGTPNDQPLGNVEKKSDAEPDWMLDYEPIKSWADFIEENEETIEDIAEIEAWKNDLPVNHQEDENTERETSGMSERITYEGHQEERKSEADEEENVIRISEHRGIRVGAVGSGNSAARKWHVLACATKRPVVPIGYWYSPVAPASQKQRVPLKTGTFQQLLSDTSHLLRPMTAGIGSPSPFLHSLWGSGGEACSAAELNGLCVFCPPQSYSPQLP
ncbi:hypothetical protein AOLI_G00312210 [Acnodon oligacanthus]